MPKGLALDEEVDDLVWNDDFEVRMISFSQWHTAREEEQQMSWLLRFNFMYPNSSLRLCLSFPKGDDDFDGEDDWVDDTEW